MTWVLWLLAGILLDGGRSSRLWHNYGGFSWNRLLGISAAKSRVSRAIGIPLTRSGRQRKLGSIFWKW